jgi:DNA repair photolyase
MTTNQSCIENKQKQVFGTKEWAKYNENFISGCSHDCRYCYAKTMAMRFHRKTADTWKQETIDMKKLSKRFTKRDGRFMFPTAHDITPSNIDHVMSFLGNMLNPGNEVLVVTKPHLECIRTLCDRFYQYRQNILFRFTIGSADNQALKFWDQFAPNFDERLESLMYAYKAGFQTSISCEPMLDDKADTLIARVLPYVTNAIWLGKGNQMTMRLKINGHGDGETIQMARKLMDSQSNGYISDLYSRHKDNPHMKWKESIKKVVGLEVSTKSGLDI